MLLYSLIDATKPTKPRECKMMKPIFFDKLFDYLETVFEWFETIFIWTLTILALIGVTFLLVSIVYSLLIGF